MLNFHSSFLSLTANKSFMHSGGIGGAYAIVIDALKERK